MIFISSETVRRSKMERGLPVCDLQSHGGKRKTAILGNVWLNRRDGSDCYHSLSKDTHPCKHTLMFPLRAGRLHCVKFCFKATLLAWNEM